MYHIMLPAIDVSFMPPSLDMLIEPDWSRGLVVWAGLFLFLAAGLLFAASRRVRSKSWLLSLFLIFGLSTTAWIIQRAATVHTPPWSATTIFALVVGVCVAHGMGRWSAVAHTAFTAVLAAIVAFLAHAGYILWVAHLGPWSLVFGAMLFVLQAATLLLLAAHTFETIDVAAHEFSGPAAPDIKFSAGVDAPWVSLHVPTHSEPPELVRQTLDALAALDYPNFEVLVVDNNTVDESLWRPVEEYCRRLGPRFRFFHLLPWPGYKSGALNFALGQTDPRAEVIGIVDADYIVEPTYLRDLVGRFADPQLAFVQTPQDYRDAEERGRYGKALHLSYWYFFAVSMLSRDRYNAIIFAGTMGLIRRSALDEVGGWDEWCITEDAELSLRLLDRGYRSLYVHRTYGRGLMPLDYAGLKKQRFRWAFGGMQLLRKHGRTLLLPRTGSRLTLAQRFAYLSGGLQWLNDPMTLAFTFLLLLSAGSLLVDGSIFLPPLVGAVVLIPPLFIFFGVFRFLWAFRIQCRCSLREAADAFGILLGLTWVVSLACLQGLTSREGVFLRTPKQGDEPSLADSVRIVSWETSLGLLCLAAAAALLSSRSVAALSVQGLLLAMLLWQSAIYLSALRSSLWARNSALQGAPVPRMRPTVPEGWGRFLSERAASARLALGLTLVVTVFLVAITNAPLLERVMRGDPLGQFLPARSVLAESDATRAGAVLLRESEATRQGSVRAALALWDASGVIVDANSTPDNSADDRVWRGTEQLAARYRDEFSARRYLALSHERLAIEVTGDSAVLSNDLRATYRSGPSVERVHRVGSDRWILRREGESWRIVRLEVNRTPALRNAARTGGGGGNDARRAQRS